VRRCATVSVWRVRLRSLLITFASVPRSSDHMGSLDSRASKSGGLYRPCGFDSHLRHQVPSLRSVLVAGGGTQALSLRPFGPRLSGTIPTSGTKLMPRPDECFRDGLYGECARVTEPGPRVCDECATHAAAGEGTSLRSLWPQGRGGSNPPFRTSLKSITLLHLMVVLSLGSATAS
jgi:hypothetical protein